MNIKTNSEVSTQSLLTHADFFLHQFDVTKDQFTFVRSTQGNLHQATFLDGREDFSTDQTFYQLPVNLTGKQQQTTPSRFIYHFGFCGSTLLAKCLSHNVGKVLCYKEPQVLIDFAKLKDEKHLHYRDKAHWQLRLSAALSKLNQSFTKEQQVLIKPSNWVNSLLPELVDLQPTQKAIFLTIPLDKYLVSVFRGGKERINFIYHLRQHLLNVMPEYKGLADAIDDGNEDIFIKVAKSTSLVYLLQTAQFEIAQTYLSDKNWRAISYTQLTEQPFDTLKSARDILSLNIEDKDLLAAINNEYLGHAKTRNQNYDSIQQKNIDMQVMDIYEKPIAIALSWHSQLTNSCKQHIA